MIIIEKTKCNFEREPLLAPFGFKGSNISELWQVAVLLEDAEGFKAAGVGVQSVLWSDKKVFDEYSQNAGNSMMFLVTAHALKMARQISFETPPDLLEQLQPLTYEYAKSITGIPGLYKTFALNALVAVDNAAWLMYCRKKGFSDFSGMIPDDSREALSCRHDSLAAVPVISYGTQMEDISKLVDHGNFLLKIKIGSDPEGDGDREKMLEWDKRRFSAIHAILKDRQCQYTENGRIPYYLDANGAYDTKDRLLRFLDHADRIGALDRIILLEEPFHQECKAEVRDIPVRLVADESAHAVEDVIERIDLGYGAIALKPIAKTLSMSFKIAAIAQKKGVPCFCADLTGNPILVDWNKNMAARLAPLPGMKLGILESNGIQNYRRWQEMKSFHPPCGAPWMEARDGLFVLDDDFYRRSGGIFELSSHYLSLASS